jgi:hypothetical protein
MEIVTQRDTSGCAPIHAMWSAYDRDTYDGAIDSSGPQQSGEGETEIDAVKNLLVIVSDQRDCMQASLIAIAVRAGRSTDPLESCGTEIKMSRHPVS